MGIWEYSELATPFASGFTAHVLERYTCLYCKSLLRPLQDVPFTESADLAYGKCCSVCGWWYVVEVDIRSHDHYSGGFACLKTLDLRDIHLPVEEVRQYLLARYCDRTTVHPQLMEETVASVFRSIGYSARVTAYRGDNGIDVYLDEPAGGGLVGIQVKNWRNSIKIEQIHSLCGALIVNGCTGGVFVTTSEFQKGAKNNAEKFSALTGIPIELIDAKRLYAALEITSRADVWDGSDPSAPWNRIHRPLLWTQ